MSAHLRLVIIFTPLLLFSSVTSVHESGGILNPTCAPLLDGVGDELENIV